MNFKKYFLTYILSFGILYAQSSVGININKEDLELEASVDMNAFSYYSESTTYMLDLAYLNTLNDSMTSIGISGVNALQGASGVSLALGAKINFTTDFMAIPLFAKATFNIPFNYTIPPLFIATSIAYAPPVLSFRDAKSYTELKVEGNVEIVPNIHLFTGFRSIDTDYNQADKVFNDSIYGGMKLIF